MTKHHSMEMKKYACAFLFALTSLGANAQQLPDPGFEDWSGSAFNGNAQLAKWNGSNVKQTYMGITAYGTMVTQTSDARTGSYAACIKNTKVEAAGIGEIAPAWLTLGTPFADISNGINGATAGTYGGISFSYRPDTMQVYVKRTGGTSENYNLVYYSWKGTSKCSKYQSKSNGCVSISEKTDEESDIRLLTDGNACATPGGDAVQIGEGWVKNKVIYNDWTLIKVPINYYNNYTPEKMNIILSAGNYPNFRATNVINGYTLIVDDISLIYSSKIHTLKFDGKPYSKFSANQTDYTYELGETATDADIPAVTCFRSGRQLTGSEITVTSAQHLGETTVIKVKAEDGSGTTTYRVTFLRKLSRVSTLAGLQLDGEALKGFSAYETDYTIEVPYGQTAMPDVTPVLGESAQTFTLTPCEVPGTATLTVYAENTDYSTTYNLRFANAKLSDTTLEDILISVDGGEFASIAGYKPTKTTYGNVEIPIGTRTVEFAYKSAYPDGEQTVTIANAGKNATSTLTVTAPGAASARVYKITCNEAESSYALLRGVSVGGATLEDFDPETFTYQVQLPVGTTALPEVTWQQGDDYQAVTYDDSGLTGTDGTVRLEVVAGNGTARQTYRITFVTAKSSVTSLAGISVGGAALEGFDPERTLYTVPLASGAALPEVSWQPGDAYQTVTSSSTSTKTRITVTAENGDVRIYTLEYITVVSEVTTLAGISVGGEALAAFQPDVYEYDMELPRGTLTLPAIGYTLADAGQTVRVAKGSVNGVTTLTVKSQAGSTAVYTLRFSVPVSSDASLADLKVGGVTLDGFRPDSLAYAVTLPSGTTSLPAIEYTKADSYQTVKVTEGGVNGVTSLVVTAEDGTRQSYTVTFSVEKSASAALLALLVGGDTIPGFDPYVLDYTYALDPSETVCPEVTVSKMEGQTVSVIMPSRLGTARVTVTPEVGSSNVYTVTFVDRQSGNCRLAGLSVGGTALEGFDPDVYTYNYILPYGTTALPAVTYTLSEASQRASLVTTGLDGDATVTVRAESGATAVYTIRFAVDRSGLATLSDLLVDGVSLPGFAPDVFDYAYTLPKGMTACPAITYVKGHASQQVALSAPLLEGEAVLLVTSGDGAASSTYRVALSFAPDEAVYLSGLTLDGVPVAGFDPATLRYEVELPYGSATPEVGYTASEGQSVTVRNDYTGAELSVTSATGVTTLYNIVYTYAVSEVSVLRDLQVFDEAQGTYVSLAGFAPDRFDYEYALAWRTAMTPAVNPVLADDAQTARVVYGGPNDTTYVEVTAASGARSVYVIAFSVPKSSDASLSAIYVGEEEITVEEGVTDYSFTLPYGTKAVPVVSYAKGLASDGTPILEQRVVLTVAPLDGVTTFAVTAEDGATLTYTLRFEVENPGKANALSYISYGDNVLIVKDGVYDYQVELPYGTTEVPVIGYTKKYEEQTVSVVKGGLGQATAFTVHSNVEGVADTEYTLTFTVKPYPYYTLTDISGCTLYPAFDPMVTRYVALVGNLSDLTFAYDDARNELEEDASCTTNYRKVKVRSLTDESLSTTYEVYVHYTSDKVPNGDFSNWTSTTYNGGVKPVGWTVPADVAESYTYKFIGISGLGGTYRTNGECTNEDNKNTVLLHSWDEHYSICGALPGMMTLGSMSINFGSAGGTTSSVSGGITFRNTPDYATMDYKYADKGTKINNMRFLLTMGGSGSYEKLFTDNKESSSWKKMTLDLSDNTVRAPQTLNITINSTHTENASDLGGLTNYTGHESYLYVDNVALHYRNGLSSLTADGNAVAWNGTMASYTMPAEQVANPVLAFTGEVYDQSFGVSWAAESGRQRVATIRSYGEDGGSSAYTLTVTRQLSSINTLNDLLVNGVSVSGFDAEVTSYTVAVPNGTRSLPDVQAVKASFYQTVAVTYGANEAVVTVTAESGDTREYRVAFVEEKSDDATLLALSVEGYDLAFDPATELYAIQLPARTVALPAVGFTKRSDGQTVTVAEAAPGQETLVTVVAEDGAASKTYTIATSLTAYAASDASLASLRVAGGDPIDFKADQYRYSYRRDMGSELYGAYAAAAAEDSVLALVAADSLTVRLRNAVSGASSAYTLVFETTPSSNARLAGLLVNGTGIDGFNAAVNDYEYSLLPGTPVSLRPVLAESGQTLAIAYDADTRVYTLTVTAEDGTVNAYTLTLVDDLSSNSQLADLKLDGVTVEGFSSAQLTYSVTLPVTDPKLSDPALPDVEALGAARGQAIAIEPHGLGETTYITVTAQDGLSESVYELNLAAAKSSNATLSDITANCVTVSGFDPETLAYTLTLASGESRPHLAWKPYDAFQTVVEETSGNQTSLTVTAEDGTTRVYTINFVADLSSEVAIEGIRVGGTPVEGFDPDTLSYDIELPVGTVSLPDITVISGASGQTATIANEGPRGTSTITVTAEDGVTTRTYELHFTVRLSDVAWLRSIESDGAWNVAYDPAVTAYTIEIPIGTRSLPEVTYTKGDAYQTVDSVWTASSVTFTVTAEDGVSRMEYTLSYVFLKSTNADLSDVALNGSSLSGFESTRYDYAIDLPVGTRSMPDVEWTQGDAYQTVDSVWTASSLTLTVTADDQLTVHTYRFDFTVLKSENDTLQDLRVGEVTLSGFRPSVFEYAYMLPIGTTVMPEVSYDPGDEYQTVTTEDNGVNGVYYIYVTAEDPAFTQTYSIAFSVEQSHNVNLASLTVNDSLPVQLYDDQNDYTVTLPYGTEEAVVAYTAGEDEQTVELTQATSVNGAATVTVTAADGVTQRTYTVHFEVEPSSEARLAMLYVNGEAVENFDPDDSDYDLTLPFGTLDLPVITWDSMPDPKGNPVPYQEVTLTVSDPVYDSLGDMVSCSYELSVVAENGKEMFDYALHFQVAKSSECHLNDLRVFGSSISGFHPDTLYYLLEYEPYTDPADLPSFTADFAWNLADPLRSSAAITVVQTAYTRVDTIYSGEEAYYEYESVTGRFNIKVTAADGSSLTYTVETVIALSDNALLDMIYVKGDSLKGFDPDQNEYMYMVPFGTVVVPDSIVSWVKQEEHQEVVLDLTRLTATIYVTAEDGETENEYVIQFVPDDYDPTQVPTEDHVCVTSMPDGSWRFTTDTKNILLYLADMTGRVMEIQPLDVVDPNCETICSPEAQGYVYRGQAGQVVVYYFVYGTDKVVASGKFLTRH